MCLNNVERCEKMKKKIFKAISVVGVLLVLCSAIFIVHHFFIGSWSNNNINRYIELTEYRRVPKIDELGKYNDIEFKYYRKNMLMFFSDAYILKVSYDAENYQKEKEDFLKNYVYETENLIDYYGDGCSNEPNFEMDTYSFKVLSSREYGLQSYPHDIVFIGTSDEKHEIAIVYYFNSDLDYIDSSFPEFIKEECGWE